MVRLDAPCGHGDDQHGDDDQGQQGRDHGGVLIRHRGCEAGHWPPRTHGSPVAEGGGSPTCPLAPTWSAVVEFATPPITKADIGDRLFVDSGRDTPLIIVTEDKAGAKIATPVIEAVKHAIIENRIDVFSVDPFVTTHGVSENDNTKMAVATRQWAQIAYETNCAVHLVHHVRKGDGRDITVEDMRGAGSLASIARAVRLLGPMSVDDAKAAGIKPG